MRISTALLFGLAIVGGSECVSAASSALTFMRQPDLNVMSKTKGICASQGQLVPENRVNKIADLPADLVFPEGSPIEEQPAGAAKLYTKASAGFWSFFNTVYINMWTDLGALIVEGDDGYVYISEPYSGLTTHTWLKCEREGDKLVAQLPQPIYTEYYGETGYVLYALRMHVVGVDDESISYEISDNQTVTFTVKEDGGIVLDLPSDFNEDEEFAPEILGLCSEDGFWAGVGDWRQDYQEFNQELVVPGKELDLEEWALTSQGQGHIVQLAVDGDEMWIKGFDEEVPDGWIHGTIDGNKVAFSTPQCLGFNPTKSRFEYFTAATLEAVWVEEWEDYMPDYQQVEKVLFDYAKADKRLTLSEGSKNLIVMINDKENEIYYHGPDFPDMQLRFQPAEFNLTPPDPVLTYFSPYNDAYGYAVLYFDLPYVTDEGYLLDRSKMYYKVYVDLEEWTFYPDDFPALEEPMILIPYDFDDGYSLGYLSGVMHMASIYADGFENLGVRSIYIDGDKEYNSYLVYFTPNEADGVNDVSEDAAPLAVKYFDLAGNQVNSPIGGLYIEVKLYENGTTKSRKVLIK